jgi:hypothetical protein
MECSVVENNLTNRGVALVDMVRPNSDHIVVASMEPAMEALEFIPREPIPAPPDGADYAV